MDVDILIIGGGLSGLHTAYELEKLDHDYLLVEARSRLGGRILSQAYSSENPQDTAYDMGPSWFWPHQTRLDMLAKELNINEDIFEQFSQGAAIYEDAQGQTQKGFFGISMDGSLRLRGGISQFITALSQQVPKDKILSHSAVTHLEYDDKHNGNTVTATVDNNGKKKTIRAQKVILALPPRNALANIQFTPALKSARVSELNSFPTWMATQAKFVAVYEKPFWREQGLSGDAMSQLGPLREVHDASANAKTSDSLGDASGDGSGYALFGFVGIPPSYRKDNPQEIIDSCLQQLVRLFGDEAASPQHVSWKDWSQEQFTSSPEDQLSGGHAQQSLKEYTNWNDCLIWSGTETAEADNEHNNGYLEGALESSQRTLGLIKSL